MLEEKQPATQIRTEYSWRSPPLSLEATGQSGVKRKAEEIALAISIDHG